MSVSLCTWVTQTPDDYSGSYPNGTSMGCRCLDGYTVTEGDEYTQCVNGVWQGRPPMCTRNGKPL